MRRVVWGLVSIVGLSLNAASAATHEEASSACANSNPDIAIIACSALIESGGEAPGDLSRDFNNRGGAYSAKGDYDHAIDDLDQSIKLDSENAGAYINRGNSYGAKKEYDRALDNYGRPLRIHPQDPEPLTPPGSVFEHLAHPKPPTPDMNQPFPPTPANSTPLINPAPTHR